MSRYNFEVLHKRIVDYGNYCPQDKVLILKQHYASDINSNRQFERINSIKHLLKILKKRDVLNYVCLLSIANVLNIDVGDGCDDNLQRLPSATLPPVPDTAKERVYDLLCTHIGRNWNDFARALHIAESYIDCLEEQHKTITKRVIEILDYYDKTCDKRKWKSGLIEALTIARRNDLRKQVQEIFDIH